MFSLRNFAAALLFVTPVFGASASTALVGTPRSVALRPDDTTETATPSLPGQAQAARRATAGLLDALRLSTAQATRLQARTEAELRDLLLAATPAAAAEAEQRYLLALGRVLTASQFVQYCALRASLESPLAYLQTGERR